MSPLAAMQVQHRGEMFLHCGPYSKGGKPVPWQILRPLDTCPDGNPACLTTHVGANAAHLGADDHGSVLNTLFRPVSLVMDDNPGDVDSMVQEATAKSHVRGTGLLLTTPPAPEPIGVKSDRTRLDCIMKITVGTQPCPGARFHDDRGGCCNLWQRANADPAVTPDL